jgi:hypothetical protein
MQLHQSSDAPNVTPPQDSAFYNRLAEQTKFLKIFSDTPGLITVLVGPPNCGKTVRAAFFCLPSTANEHNFISQTGSCTVV